MYISKRWLSSLPRGEYVYIIQDVEISGRYKIGCTNNPKRRIEGEFGVKLPFEFEVIRIIPTYDAKKLEAELHQRFATKRMNGEWFNLSEKDVLELLCMESSTQPPDENDHVLYHRDARPDRGFEVFKTLVRFQSNSSHHSTWLSKFNETYYIGWSSPLNRPSAHMFYGRKQFLQVMQSNPDTVSAAYEMTQMLTALLKVAPQYLTR